METSYLIPVYAAYATTSIGLTVWLARTLFKNGAVFLEEVFADQPRMAEAVNRGIGISPLSFFAHPAATDTARHGLIVGFGTPSASSYSADLDALVGLLVDVA